MDDILVWGRNTAEHNKRILKVLERARAVSLRHRIKKCKFKLTQLNYIGYTPNCRWTEEKVAAVQQMPKPQSN